MEQMPRSRKTILLTLNSDAFCALDGTNGSLQLRLNVSITMSSCPRTLYFHFDHEVRVVQRQSPRADGVLE